MLLFMKITVFDISFNRYMVECECHLKKRYRRRGRVLIDTWWNVNMDQGMLYQTADAF